MRLAVAAFVTLSVRTIHVLVRKISSRNPVCCPDTGLRGFGEKSKSGQKPVQCQTYYPLLTLDSASTSLLRLKSKQTLMAPNNTVQRNRFAPREGSKIEPQHRKDKQETNNRHAPLQI